ncbi:uncharacterized protein LOC126737743 isoform X3 [Anthonomus grandis grandis]|uniref:uncharacterized protein LOC126737743 isoform X3 n=1 Tax=Anthonomus grandis grandis TaxID=2921223 RepID=UPI002164F97B|nr:uncharacterized protein LOC126737743 isoform X3 [Anthonomus grandis grandis]
MCRFTSMGVMPTDYIRKSSVQRGNWTEEDIVNAAEAVRNGVMGIREACCNFNNIPPPTFRRRFKNNDFQKRTLGQPCVRGIENEKKIKLHIQKLQKHGFAPTRECVRAMAFNLAEQLKIKHTFNKEKKLAGYDWLTMFLKRNPDLSVRKAEGVSLARCKGMNKTDVSMYFNLLETTLIEGEIMNKAGHIFNMDETGLQLNNKPGYGIATKGSKNVAAITASEKGKIITVSCCNAEGYYIPPTCIFKGKNKKAEFEDGMPPGSTVYMNEKSAYINTDIMFAWLKNQFIPRKPQGKVLLLLDGHARHCSSSEMLEYADEHGVIPLCLPSHTTQFLQPLDRCFFKSLKAFFNNACNTFIRTNPTRKINRLQFGQLLTKAWSKAATVENAVSAFRSTGVCPFNPSAIPEYAYSGSEEKMINLDNTATVNNDANRANNDENQMSKQEQAIPSTSTSGLNNIPSERDEDQNQDTPGTLLNKFSPVPSTPANIENARKRAKQVAYVLTSSENIQKHKLANARKKDKEKKKELKKIRRL